MAPDELDMLRDAAGGWVREHGQIKALRILRESASSMGFDPALYRGMADMGWTGVVVPEADGGFGFGHAGMGLIAEQLGRTLVASPLIDTVVVVAGALVLAGSAAQKAAWLPPLVAGSAHAALALDEGARHDPAATALAARCEGEHWVLEGTKRPVGMGLSASLLLVAARTSGEPGEAQGVTLFLCPGETPGLAMTTLDRIDSRGAAAITFTGCRLGTDAVLGEVDGGLPLLDRVLDRGRAVLAAEMLGGAQAAFDTTLEYLRTRVQFDRPIGSFQALQHRAAALLAEIELARSAVEAALVAIDADDPDVARLASLAKAMAGKAFRRCAQEMIQLHGGIGMTDEHDAGLYLKRAQVADMTLGDVAFHRQRYARLSGF